MQQCAALGPEEVVRTEDGMLGYMGREASNTLSHIMHMQSLFASLYAVDVGSVLCGFTPACHCAAEAQHVQAWTGLVLTISCRTQSDALGRPSRFGAHKAHRPQAQHMEAGISRRAETSETRANILFSRLMYCPRLLHKPSTQIWLCCRLHPA